MPTDKVTGLRRALPSSPSVARGLPAIAVREGPGRRVARRMDVNIELVLWARDPSLDALGADGEGPAAHLACGEAEGMESRRSALGNGLGCMGIAAASNLALE